jgi:hypothetical protein
VRQGARADRTTTGPAAVIWVRWAARRLTCLVRGHAREVMLEPGRVVLHCSRCGRQSPGWDVPADRVGVPRSGQVGSRPAGPPSTGVRRAHR